MTQAGLLTIAPLGIPTRPIESFRRRFGEAHLILACQAALPIAVTPDLLYRLRVRFQRDINGEPLDISWIAVSDLLLSSLFREVDQGVYEMDREIRHELLNLLRYNPHLGQQRLLELADFLLTYTQPDLRSSDPDVQTLAQVQEWTAFAYLEPGQAIRGIALAIKNAYHHNQIDLIRLAHLVETLESPLGDLSEDFKLLLAYARGMANFVRGDAEAAKHEFGQLRKRKLQTQIGKENLPIPEPFKSRIPRVWLLWLGTLVPLAVGVLIWWLISQASTSSISSLTVPPSLPPSPSTITPSLSSTPTSIQTPAITQPQATTPNQVPDPTETQVPDPTQPQAPTTTQTQASTTTQTPTPATTQPQAPATTQTPTPAAPQPQAPATTQTPTPATTQTQAPATTQTPTPATTQTQARSILPINSVASFCIGRTFKVINTSGTGTADFRGERVSAGQKIEPPGFLRTGEGNSITVEVRYPNRTWGSGIIINPEILRRGGTVPDSLGSTVIAGLVVQHTIPPNSEGVDICELR